MRPIKVVTEGRRIVLRPRGEIDIAQQRALDRAYDATVRQGRGSIVVDLRDVTFMDGTGLNWLARLANLADVRSGSVLVRNSGPTTRRILWLAPVDVAQPGSCRTP